jgi:hypothetical protein
LSLCDKHHFNYPDGMLNSRNLGFHMHRIAWSVVVEELPRRWIRPLDPWKDPEDPGDDPEGTSRERRLGCLQVLYVYTRMVKILQRRIDWTVNEALATGASYGDVADACGVSRQAVRQRWLRRRQEGDARTLRPKAGLRAVSWDGAWPYEHHKDIRVRLVGGPRHGDWDVAQPGQIVKIEVPRPPDSADNIKWTAVYTPTEDDLSVYTFNGIESKQMPPRQMPRWPRVFEIAKEFDVPSKAVLAKLQGMDEYVRSASSTVRPDMLGRLWDHFQANQQASTDT